MRNCVGNVCGCYGDEEEDGRVRDFSAPGKEVMKCEGDEPNVI